MRLRGAEDNHIDQDAPRLRTPASDSVAGQARLDPETDAGVLWALTGRDARARRFEPCRPLCSVC